MALSDLVVRQAKSHRQGLHPSDIDGLLPGRDRHGAELALPLLLDEGAQAHVAGHLSRGVLREARALRDEARASARTSTRAFTASKSAPQSNSPVKTPSRRSTRSGLHTANSASKKGRQTTLSISLASSPGCAALAGQALDLRHQTPDLLEVIARIERRKGALRRRKSGRGSTRCSATRWWSCRAWNRTLPTLTWWRCRCPVNHNPFLRMAELPAVAAPAQVSWPAADPARSAAAAIHRRAHGRAARRRRISSTSIGAFGSSRPRS